MNHYSLLYPNSYSTKKLNSITVFKPLIIRTYYISIMSNTNGGPTPVPNSTTSFWRTFHHELDNHRTTPDLPTECDVLIIGAGFSGTALTYHLYDENPSPPSVVILEAREACSGATGRNGGHLKPDAFFNLSRNIEKFGTRRAVEVAKFETLQVSAVKELVEKEGIDCDFVLTRTCDAILDEKLAKETDEVYTKLVNSGVVDLKDVQRVSSKYAERVRY